MNINKHIILFFSMLAGVALLYSCGGAQREEAQEPAYEEVAAVATDSVDAGKENTDISSALFEADTLNEEQLMAFQLRGRQKLQDFIDYIEIISNKSYDSILKNEAKNQIISLFTDSNAIIDIPLIDNGNAQPPITISSFLDNMYHAYDSIKVTTDSVNIYSIEKTGKKTEYIGVISAKANIMAFKGDKTIFSSDKTRWAQILIRKENKVFGEEIKQVWSVSIKEIR